MSFNDLLTTLKGRESKKIANNTYLVKRGDNLAIKLHQTDVAIFTLNGDIILNSGGWHTSTTKDRINTAIRETGKRISQERGNWFIDGLKFQDNLTIHANGKITGYAKDNPKADTKIKAKIKAYAKLCADAIPLEQPSSGDCWYCLMKTQDNESLGDAIKSSEHIESHIKENYIVPSLVFNALRESGNPDMILSLVFNNTEKHMLDLAQERVYKAVYRFICKRFNFAV